MCVSPQDLREDINNDRKLFVISFYEGNNKAEFPSRFVLHVFSSVDPQVSSASYCSLRSIASTSCCVRVRRHSWLNRRSSCGSRMWACLW